MPKTVLVVTSQQSYTPPQRAPRIFFVAGFLLSINMEILEQLFARPPVDFERREGNGGAGIVDKNGQDVSESRS